MRAAGHVEAATLRAAGAALRPGMTTADVDVLVRRGIARRGGTPSQLGFDGFPAAVCTSKNAVVCHGSLSAQFEHGAGHTRRRRGADRMTAGRTRVRDPRVHVGDRPPRPYSARLSQGQSTPPLGL